jgi:hypothetical protein
MVDDVASRPAAAFRSSRTAGRFPDVQSIDRMRRMRSWTILCVQFSSIGGCDAGMRPMSNAYAAI